MHKLSWCLIIVAVAGAVWAQGGANGGGAAPTGGGAVDGGAPGKPPAREAGPPTEAIATAVGARLNQALEQQATRFNQSLDQRLATVQQAQAQSLFYLLATILLGVVNCVMLGYLLQHRKSPQVVTTTTATPFDSLVPEPADRVGHSGVSKERLALVQDVDKPDPLARLEGLVKATRDAQLECATKLGNLAEQVGGMRSWLVSSGLARAATEAVDEGAPALPAASESARGAVSPGTSRPAVAPPSARQAADTSPRAPEPSREMPPAPPPPWAPREVPPAAPAQRPAEYTPPVGATGETAVHHLLGHIVALAKAADPAPTATAVALLQHVPQRVRTILTDGHDDELTQGLIRDLDRALYEPVSTERLKPLMNLPEGLCATLADYLGKQRSNWVAELNQRQLRRIVATPGDALVPDRIEENRGRERKVTDRLELDGKVADVAPGDGGWALAGQVVKTVAAQVYEYRRPE